MTKSGFIVIAMLSLAGFILSFALRHWVIALAFGAMLVFLEDASWMIYPRLRNWLASLTTPLASQSLSLSTSKPPRST
jgi:hypothetical protein